MTTTNATAANATEPEYDYESEYEPEPRIAIWSLSARVIGAYFVLFLVQYAPGVALEVYAHWPPPAAGALALARTAVDIIKGSGPIGLGAATNALAIAVTMEAIMVLAKIISMHQREEGYRQGRKHGRQEGIEEGIEQERKRNNAKLRAFAKKYGIPEDELPIADADADDAA